ncbi:penicillin acylase family protein [Tengunoibacter tsumagoiensis]|uniref:Peptidase S45 n=1 Tax=Tengunoibacter tsumagoiensis TaxID=2014871 RepID=A0A402A2W1_9CHLR|nr:penicillin acylase family protein [Tengunoibacter tsumagoiensis]GCE13389.1 peptidase S45 [Tengunoibacter tsumagoiensis]
MASRWQKTRQSAADLTSLLSGSYDPFTRQSLPRKSGTLHIPGLHSSVTIQTDTYGVPHIYAHNDDDLYFAQGYVHAQDRLWQMEFNRRLASGRLSELFGAPTLEVDRFCRRLGLHRAAQAHLSRLSEHDRHLLEVYSQGVNAYINTHSETRIKKLPIEFQRLHTTPVLWEPAATLLWSKLQAWSLSGNWETELIRAQLIEKLGVEQASRLETGDAPSHPLTIPPGVSYRGINPDLLEQSAQIKELSGLGALSSSNSWVVDGTRSQTGKPLLCNDPHLGQAVPSVWYECHLQSPTLNVIGVSFPGNPGIIIGHNDQIAWGITNAVSDVQDLYIERFNAQGQYEFQDHWEDATIVRESIIVKDQAKPVIEEVYITRHGPILTTFTSTQQSELPLALRWTAFEDCTLPAAIYLLNRATDWEQFKTALQQWDTPAQNFVYADRSGNIGYLMAGKIPIRARGQALLPSPGWTGENEWTGYIPFAELPQSYNPEQHFIVTANNRMLDDNYHYYITHEWANGYRAQRITNLLLAKEKFTLEDMQTIQTDQFSLPATEYTPYLLQLSTDTPLKRAAHEILLSWDYTLSPQSIAAAIYTTFQRKLEQIVLDAILGDDELLQRSYQGRSSSINSYTSRAKPWLIRLLKVQDDSWFAHSALPNGPSSWETALQRAFEATIEELSHTLTANILRWQYGAIHTLTYKHPMGTTKTLEKTFNRGPFPIGGDNDTINVSASSIIHPEEVVATASYRLIADLNDWDNSRSIHSPGQSGHPMSPHYADQLPLWQQQAYHSLPFSQQRVQKSTIEQLELQP